jgi:osmoprotectant transport system permease protein
VRHLADPLLWAALALAAITFAMPALSPIFARLYPEIVPPVYARDGFAALLLSHAVLVAVPAIVTAIVGVGLAVAATRTGGGEVKALVEAGAVIGQAIPPVAVLAVAVPAIGFGAVPTMVALAIYGLLPVVENAVAGLRGVPPAVREAATAMGFTPAQVLWRVELPLAAPAILNGLRLSVIVNIGTAAIGATVGARTLGMPIVTGLVVNKPSYVIQGAVVLALFAIVADLAFDRVAARFARHRRSD